jgi:hypothetical protein
VVWRDIRARPDAPVSAELASTSGVLSSAGGEMRYHAGRDYIVSRDGERAVVQGKIFERTYERRSDGLYQKRRDVIYRYFTLPVAVNVITREGRQRADPGDWIVEGVEGELWPVAAARAGATYEEI